MCASRTRSTPAPAPLGLAARVATDDRVSGAPAAQHGGSIAARIALARPAKATTRVGPAKDVTELRARLRDTRDGSRSTSSSPAGPGPAWVFAARDACLLAPSPRAQRVQVRGVRAPCVSGTNTPNVAYSPFAPGRPRLSARVARAKRRRRRRLEVASARRAFVRRRAELVARAAHEQARGVERDRRVRTSAVFAAGGEGARGGNRVGHGPGAGTPPRQHRPRASGFLLRSGDDGAPPFPLRCSGRLSLSRVPPRAANRPDGFRRRWRKRWRRRVRITGTAAGAPNREGASLRHAFFVGFFVGFIVSSPVARRCLVGAGFIVSSPRARGLKKRDSRAAAGPNASKLGAAATPRVGCACCRTRTARPIRRRRRGRFGAG